MRASLVTERLTLRAPREEDAARLARLANDPAIAGMTMMIPHPYPPEVAEGWILIQQARRRMRREFVFVAEAKGEGVIGSVGVFRRGAEAPWEIGYWVGRPYWGLGYASEMVAAAAQFALEELQADPLIAGYFDGNDASRRVLERNGFRATGSSCRVYALGRRERVECVGMALPSAAGGAAQAQGGMSASA